MERGLFAPHTSVERTLPCATCGAIVWQSIAARQIHRAYSASEDRNTGRRKYWIYEIKLDGYRAIAFKTGGRVHLRSRNDNDFSVRYLGIVKALAPIPDDTVIDGEVVALDADGKSSFNNPQNFGSGQAPLHFYIFDLMVPSGISRR